jgi:hypothetical protein
MTVATGKLVVRRFAGRRDQVREYRIHVDGQVLATVAQGGGQLSYLSLAHMSYG